MKLKKILLGILIVIAVFVVVIVGILGFNGFFNTLYSDGAKKAYKEHEIGLKSVENARTLAGYVGADNRRIKDNVLIRSGNLSELSDEDMEILKSKYNLQYVVDFRTRFERELQPDRNISLTAYMSASIVKDFDDARKETMKKNLKPDGEKESFLKRLDDLIGFFDTQEDVSKMYNEFIDSKNAKQGYIDFFYFLLDNNREGAVLWHCTQGKDRAGFATVLLLSALGVDRNTILDDYEASSVSNETSMRVVNFYFHLKGVDDKKIDKAMALIGAKRDRMEALLNRIDKEYGGMDAFLHKEIGLTDESIKKLQDKYLN